VFGEAIEFHWPSLKGALSYRSRVYACAPVVVGLPCSIRAPLLIRVQNKIKYCGIYEKDEKEATCDKNSSSTQTRTEEALLSSISCIFVVDLTSVWLAKFHFAHLKLNKEIVSHESI